MNMRDEKKTFAKNLGDSQPLVLEDDCQVLLHPLWVEAFFRAGLKFERILLKILKSITKEHPIGCLNGLNAVLRRH